jgi:hypothetical protein|mmetsp:Transcript_10549/g.19803  ORF Transcript_10549/g.19803 Transcript_10549/m.19803 type:complete len:253 (-) Transcript_10549:202-960(-)
MSHSIYRLTHRWPCSVSCQRDCWRSGWTAFSPVVLQIALDRPLDGPGRGTRKTLYCYRTAAFTVAPGRFSPSAIAYVFVFVRTQAQACAPLWKAQGNVAFRVPVFLSLCFLRVVRLLAFGHAHCTYVQSSANDVSALRMTPIGIHASAGVQCRQSPMCARPAGRCFLHVGDAICECSTGQARGRGLLLSPACGLSELHRAMVRRFRGAFAFLRMEQRWFCCSNLLSRHSTKPAPILPKCILIVFECILERYT